VVEPPWPMPEIASNLTPMMRQYLETKAQVGDALLFFRLGDFYELTWERRVLRRTTPDMLC
jgi:hypothetical protein